ncbi:MAG TPA: sigma-54 dependent transcriptional regulator [Thermodesulfovibrionales bacterium]|nr:sigma-54 dependent transcriptional regulator [Thermodesulfovibrionales bacterium]
MREKILVVDDEKLIRWSLKENLGKVGFDVIEAENGNDALKVFSDSMPDIVLLDINLPDISGIEVLRAIKSLDKDVPVIIITAFGNIQTAVDAMRFGAHDFIEKPFEIEKLNIVIDKALENAFLRREVTRYKAKDGDYGFESIIGTSPKMLELKKIIKRISASNTTTVLLEGETGTGKDFFARVIHDQSARASKSFIDVNCAALPENLIESELFGYEKGAFTGASGSKKGLFEISSGGTIYLDEIGDMNYDLQAKLLKVIDTKNFRRLGGTTEIMTDVRIIAATNRDLLAKIKAGTFREDLYWRLKVIPLYMPPLRERSEDILLLSQKFMDSLNCEFKKHIKGLSEETVKLFMTYKWPGNVRELKNVIERAMILETEEYITPEHLPLEIEQCGDSKSGRHKSWELFDVAIPEQGLDIEQVEKELLKKALEMAKGNQSKAARLLNLGRDAFRYRVQKFGLESEMNGEG